MADACVTCRFWDAYAHHKEAVGDCRRRAPAISDELIRSHAPPRSMDWDSLPTILYPASAFPVTKAESWCGEYEHPGHGECPC